MDHAGAGVGGGVFITQAAGAIRRAIVHQDNLKVRVRLRFNARQAARQVILDIVDRNDDADQFAHLDRIHKILLHLVEDQDAEDENQAHEDETVGEPAPADELAGAEEAVFEGFQHGGDGVEAHQGVDIDAFPHQSLGLAEGIDDRGGVHPELHQEREEDLQVAILGGKR